MYSTCTFKGDEYVLYVVRKMHTMVDIPLEATGPTSFVLIQCFTVISTSNCQFAISALNPSHNLRNAYSHCNMWSFVNAILVPAATTCIKIYVSGPNSWSEIWFVALNWVTSMIPMHVATPD